MRVNVSRRLSVVGDSFTKLETKSIERQLRIGIIQPIPARTAALSEVHPVAGGSWEDLAIESLIGAAPAGTEAYFFRTAAGAEIDLLLKRPGERKPWAIEIKRSLAPKLERGFHNACDTVKPSQRRVVYGGKHRSSLSA